MRKGFTLVELLVVLVIIGMLSLVAYPSILKIIKDSRESAFKSQKILVEKVTSEWAVSNPMKVPEIKKEDCTCEEKCISINDLKESGFLSGDEANNLNGGVRIKCGCAGGMSCNTCKYVYEYHDEPCVNQ